MVVESVQGGRSPWWKQSSNWGSEGGRQECGILGIQERNRLGIWGTGQNSVGLVSKADS